MSVKASVITCQTWLTTDWSSSGKLLSTQALESAMGDRLRLPQYDSCFGDDAAAADLVEELAESQPPYEVNGQ